MWHLTRRNGATCGIPQDPFVFWGLLQVYRLVSTPLRTEVLWCSAAAGDDWCFGATLSNSDAWMEEHGGRIQGQWRLAVQQEGGASNPRLQLLKPVEELPGNALPQWLESMRA